MLNPTQKAIVALVLLALAFSSGWSIREAILKGDQKRQTQAALKASAQEVARSALASQTLETAIRQDLDRVQTIKVAVAQRIKTNPVYRHEQHLDPAPAATTAQHRTDAVGPDLLHQPVLDAGTVRLLNAARTDRLEPAPSHPH